MSSYTPKLDVCYRIRHIRHISLRRLSTTDIPSLFFTLHSLSTPTTLLYRSEKHTNSRNPNWKKLSHTIYLDKLTCSESRFILRIWMTENSSKLLLEWTVDLNELVGIEKHRVGVLTSPNLVLFGLRNASKSNLLYTDRSLVEGLKVFTHEIELPYSHDFTSSTTFGKTYSLPTLHTLAPLIGAAYTEERRKANFCAGIKVLLQLHYEHTQELENLRYSINQLKNRKKEFQNVIEKKKTYLSEVIEKNRVHQLETQQSIEEHKCSQLSLEDKRDRHSTRKYTLVTQLNAITCRRLSLIQNLGSIYDIVIPPEPQITGKLEIPQEIFLPTILGIPLPKQNTINQTYIPDIGINTSLGFVVHIISLLQLILRLPLRFPVLFYGSQSMIYNELSFSGDEFHEIPLYFKRRGDLSINKLEHALFLLNHDLIQVRQHLGLVTTDFKATLKNLQSLFTESENCLKRLSKVRYLPTGNMFNQENQDSIDLIFAEVTDNEINEFKDSELLEIPGNIPS
ncbi:UV radiation resistance-associated gene protein [Oopsacas minuta]|uniref:UV radiation resistance-associated gene protein n=1 Tax=Oopsacas minuta TaxID=111878 RepID=A0AAV7JPZ4_9METZ|nr:UV radiation resistance-associated gene protein [Oopsacas minuta]